MEENGGKIRAKDLSWKKSAIAGRSTISRKPRQEMTDKDGSGQLNSSTEKASKASKSTEPGKKFWLCNNLIVQWNLNGLVQP